MTLAQPLVSGAEAVVPLYLRSPRSPGDRVVTFVVRYRPVPTVDAPAGVRTDESTVAYEERVPVSKAFGITSTLAPQSVGHPCASGGGRRGRMYLL